MMKGEVFILIGLLALSGCLSTVDSDDGENPASQEIPSSLDLHLRLEDCTGIGSVQDYVIGMHPIGPPAGWPANDDPTDLRGSMFDMHECERVEWGPFVRGPVTFVIESYLNGDVPTQCIREARGSISFMLSIGLNDPELVEYFQERLGLPAYLANITIDKNVEGDLHEWTWHWGPEEPQSHLTATGYHDQRYNERDLWETYFWDNGTSVNALLLHLPDESDILVRSPVAIGRLEPPMVLAQQGHNEWQGRSDWYFPEEMLGTVVEFQDWECTLAAGSSDDGNSTAPGHALSRLRR